RPVYYVPGPRLLSATEPVREGVPVDDALRFPGGDDLARGLLGDRAIGRLGPVFPEINIAAAAPAGEPPIEFSSRERILVVTEVDEDLEIPPRVIVGFNPDRVKAIRDRNPANYEEEIKTEYKGLLEDYRAKLLRLVEAFEGKDEFRPFLESKGDVLAAMKDLPIQDREITEAYREFETAREKLEDFHDRRPVKVGDKIVIPARTPHALGPGVVVIEPTMERPAERVLGGGTMYPLPRELPRPADMTRLVDQLAVHIFEPGIPGEEIERPPIQQEPLRERFEHEGLGSQLITFNQAGTLELPTGGVLHTLAVVGEGKATVAAGNVVYPIPRAASDAALPVIPASSESFKIVAAAGTKIFDRALTEPEEVVTYPVREKRTSAVPAAVESLEGVTYLSSGETMAVSDILTIAGETSIPPIVGQPEPRPITVVVQRGEISVKLQDAAEPVVIPAGQTRTFPEMAVIEMITATSPDAAVVKLDYEKTEAEKIVYGYIETLRKHFEEIEKKGPVTLVMPSEMFRGVGINNPGSAAWWQKMFRTYVNESITIIPYWSGKHPKVEEVGLDAATKMVEEQLAEQPEDATTILVATREKIRLAGDEHKKTMSKVRILAVPDVDEADALKDEAGQVAEGWFFARETIGTGLLLSLVTPDMVFFDDDPDSAASDLQRFMELLLKRDVSRGDLCGMMSFEEMSRALETWGKEGKELPAWFERIKDSFDNITAYLRFLIDRALLKMPIRPFNANKELLERQENMFKTIRAV
ncbi:MAG: hypothetical protein PVH45_01015, partial [Candidatus Omnitrophota bacterium]